MRKGQDMQQHVRITTNAAEVNRWMGGQIKKVNQAAKAALSKTVLQVQHQERIELNRMFTVRKAAFMRNRVKVFKFPKATPEGLVAVIGINSNVRGSPLLLSVFEDGGKKSPVQGSRIAIPITGGKARPAFKKGVPAAYRMNRLNFTKNKDGIPVGRQRTFILPTKKGEYAVFQRGKGGRSLGADKDISPLYIFKNTVPLKKRMHFVKIATDLAGFALPRHFDRYLRLYLKQ
ncbi:MAG: DUF6441 family protein [Novosphingobium sp.]